MININTPCYVIIPTHNRHNELKELVATLWYTVNGIFIIDNASHPAVELNDVVPTNLSCLKTSDGIIGEHIVHIIYDKEQPPHLYRMWNDGLNAVEKCAYNAGYNRWNVAILNDDAVIHPTWIDIVSYNLRKYNVSAASTLAIGSGSHNRIVREITDHAYSSRLCPWAFMLAGEQKLRADERFRWWYGDNDLDWQARQLNGVLLIGSPPVSNKYANSTTVGVLAEQAGRDSTAFLDKWKIMP